MFNKKDKDIKKIIEEKGFLKKHFSFFQKSVLEGNFESAYLEMKKMGLKRVEEELIEISINDYNTMAYAFLMFAIDKEKKASLYAITANLFINSYNVWDGSYKVAQMYAEKALSMDENCIEALAVIMYLGICPDSDLTREDMIKARQRIEKINPNYPYLQEKIWY